MKRAKPEPVITAAPRDRVPRLADDDCFRTLERPDDDVWRVDAQMRRSDLRGWRRG